MNFLSYFELSLVEIYFVVFVVFIASIIRGFNGFGFSATCISGFSFILPAIEIVPIILILEVFISIFMIPYIWNKIDWNFVFKLIDWNSYWLSYRSLFIKISIFPCYTPNCLYISNIFFIFINERLCKSKD